MKKAIYPGSFDPITHGHIDIIHRALSVFDKVVIAIFENPQKTPFFTVEERLKLIRDIFKGNSKISTESFSGLVVSFALENEIFTIIRGLRAVSDFDYEFQIALTNRKLNDKIDTVFFMTDSHYAYLSSSLVRQLAFFKGDVSSFVPHQVEAAFKEKNAFMNDILGLLASLEASILESKRLPFTHKIVIDEEPILQLIDKIRPCIKEGDLSRRTVEMYGPPESKESFHEDMSDLERIQERAKKLRHDSEAYAHNVFSHLQLSILRLQKQSAQLEKTLQNSSNMLTQLKEHPDETY